MLEALHAWLLEMYILNPHACTHNMSTCTSVSLKELYDLTWVREYGKGKTTVQFGLIDTIIVC